MPSPDDKAKTTPAPEEPIIVTPQGEAAAPAADAAPEVKVGQVFASFRRSTAQKAKNFIHKPAVATSGRVLGRMLENAVTAGGAILILGAGANVVNNRINKPAEPVVVETPPRRPRSVPNESQTAKTA